MASLEQIFTQGAAPTGGCVRDPAQLSADLAAIVPGLLEDPTDPSLSIGRLMSDHGPSLPAAVCEFAFGMRLPTTSITRGNYFVKTNRMRGDFDLRVCSSRYTSMLPSRLSPEKSKDFPFLQAERGFVYQKSMAAAISKLTVFAEQLRESSKAATFVTQSAVSRQIRALEDQLGEQLFRRGPRGLTLTEAGDLLADYVGRGLGELATGLYRIGQPRRRTTIAVTASRTFARGCWHRALAVSRGFIPGWISGSTATATTRASSVQMWMWRSGWGMESGRKG
jgi:hypothetical protein